MITGSIIRTASELVGSRAMLSADVAAELSKLNPNEHFLSNDTGVYIIVADGNITPLYSWVGSDFRQVSTAVAHAVEIEGQKDINADPISQPVQTTAG